MIFEPVTQPLDKDNAGSMVDMTCHLQWLIRNTTRQQKTPLRGHPSGKWIRSGAAAVHNVHQAPQSRGGMKYSSSERGPRIHCLEKTKQISCYVTTKQEVRYDNTSNTQVERYIVQRHNHC